MKIQCTTVEEHEDGSATVAIETDKEGTEFLCAVAVEEIFKQAAEAIAGQKKEPMKLDVSALVDKVGRAPF